MMPDLRGFHKKKNDLEPPNHNYGLKIKTDGSWDFCKLVQPNNFSKSISLSGCLSVSLFLCLVCH